ncbi:UPF0001 protein YggS [hydrothermal vent metagenome]|uniref:UPF0001 protein YggS n=1 Tax=hydrothermal vent metagenome TaxID=652676 RepID=A0A3B0XXR2_9ZZZZ
MSPVAQRLEAVRDRIATAAQRSGRDPKEVKLIAVSKRQSAEAIRELVDLGVQDFAESQIQEAQQKTAVFSNLPLNWHFVGHLQSNKTRHIAGQFACIHSIDSLKLIRRIAESTIDLEQPVRLLLQVNIADDPNKHGMQREEVLPLIDTVLSEAPKGVKLCGLMTIGFRDADETDVRRGFSDLRDLLEICQNRFGKTLCELSMGMSGDYVTAVEEGATMVRVGNILFGERGRSTTF